MTSKIKAIILLLILPSVLFFSNCKKTADAANQNAINVSVQVLQDSIPVPGALVTLLDSTNQTKTQLMNQISDKNGIVNFVGVDKSFHIVYASKDCSYSYGNTSINVLNIKAGETKKDTVSLLAHGVMKISNNTSNIYQVASAVSFLFYQVVNPNSSIYFQYTPSFGGDSSVYTQQLTGSYPHPIRAKNYPVICGDTITVSVFLP